MLVSSFNLNTLFVFLKKGDNKAPIISRVGDVARISNEKDETLGFNFFNQTGFENGPVILDEAQVEKLNQQIKEAGFTDVLEADSTPKFVIGHVIKMEDHPDSDHLHVTQVEIGQDEPIQIVSGSPNMQENIDVVVALPGAIMPSGQIIWPGKLLGIESFGMMSSGRELGLKNAPNKPGSLILPAGFGQVGDAFDFAKGNEIFK